MIIDLTSLGSDLVISGIFAFLVGMVSMTVYSRLKTTFEEGRYKTNEAVIEAVVLEYTRRLHDYDKVISELRAKVDIVESRIKPHEVVSQDPSQPQPHVALMSEPVTVTQHAAIEKEVNSPTCYRQDKRTYSPLDEETSWLRPCQQRHQHQTFPL